MFCSQEEVEVLSDGEAGTLSQSLVKRPDGTPASHETALPRISTPPVSGIGNVLGTDNTKETTFGRLEFADTLRKCTADGYRDEGTTLTIACPRSYLMQGDKTSMLGLPKTTDNVADLVNLDEVPSSEASGELLDKPQDQLEDVLEKNPSRVGKEACQGAAVVDEKGKDVAESSQEELFTTCDVKSQVSFQSPRSSRRLSALKENTNVPKSPVLRRRRPSALVSSDGVAKSLKAEQTPSTRTSRRISASEAETDYPQAPQAESSKGRTSSLEALREQSTTCPGRLDRGQVVAEDVTSPVGSAVARRSRRISASLLEAGEKASFPTPEATPRRSRRSSLQESLSPLKMLTRPALLPGSTRKAKSVTTTRMLSRIEGSPTTVHGFMPSPKKSRSMDVYDFQSDSDTGMILDLSTLHSTPADISCIQPSKGVPGTRSLTPKKLALEQVHSHQKCSVKAQPMGTGSGSTEAKSRRKSLPQLSSDTPTRHTTRLRKGAEAEEVGRLVRAHTGQIGLKMSL